MPTARVLWLTRLAARAGLACCLVLALLWTAKIALSIGGPVASHWEQEPDPIPPSFFQWFPLYDNEISFCLEDRAGVGVSDAWVQDNLSLRWGVSSRPWCEPGAEPDLRVIIEDLGSPQPAGWSRVDVPSGQWGWLSWRFYQHCEVTVNASTFWQRDDYVWPGTSTWLPDVPEKTLTHEFGHCTGLQHRDEPDYQGAMYPMMLYYPTEEEVASLHRDYDPWRFYRAMAPIAWVLRIAA
ncbi:MAG: hypothetical protein Q8P22_06505 [Chloroflexota bacterium]|nr:hypothetical protein [Chloroflexota bacterium]